MEEILEGRNLEDEMFPQLFTANGLEARLRLALEVQSSRQESGWGGMSVWGWKLGWKLPHLQQCFKLLLCIGNKWCYNSGVDLQSFYRVVVLWRKQDFLS